jgi:hypothetical protein
MIQFRAVDEGRARRYRWDYPTCSCTQLVPIFLGTWTSCPDQSPERIAAASAVPQSRSSWDELVNCYLGETDVTQTA